MASADDTIVIGIELDDGSIKKAVIKANDLQDKIGGAVSSGVDKSLTGLITQFTFIGKIAGKAFDVVAGSINKAIGESSAADSALSAFNNTLANTGKFTEKASEDFQNFAKSLQQAGTVSDDAVIKASTSLISIGGLTGQALQNATKAAVDLSAGLGKDLDSSFNLVAKAASGNTEALSRYGIKIDESIPKSQRFAEALRLINERFGGLDEAKANTFDGALTKLNNSIGDFFEEIGQRVTRSPAIIQTIKTISELISTFTDTIKKSLGSSDIFKDILISAAVFTQAMIASAISIGDGFVLAFLRAEQAWLAFKVLVTAGLSDTFNQQLAETNSQIDEIQNKDYANSPAIQFLDTFIQKLSETNGQLNTLNEGVNNSTIPTLDAASVSFASIGESISTGFTSAIDYTGIAVDDLVKRSQKAAEQFKKDFQQTGQNARVALGQGVGSGFAAFGKALVTGENALTAFTKAFVGAIGQAAVSEGTAMILRGIGYSLDPIISARFPGVGPGLIAAGAGLAAFGGVLSALAGGGAGATANAGGGGGGGATSSASPFEDETITGVPAVERDTRSQVTVNIQGNVLDRRETGLEIANVLQEYFDTNDGVLARA